MIKFAIAAVAELMVEWESLRDAMMSMEKADLPGYLAEWEHGVPDLSDMSIINRLYTRTMAKDAGSELASLLDGKVDVTEVESESKAEKADKGKKSKQKDKKKETPTARVDAKLMAYLKDSQGGNQPAAAKKGDDGSTDNSKAARMMCVGYSSTDGCTWGKACKFIHSVPKLGSAAWTNVGRKLMERGMKPTAQYIAGKEED